MPANKEVETINSFELATLLSKDHTSVRSAIERNVARGLIVAEGPFKIDIDSAYRAIQVYILDKQDSIRLCEKINRWDENLIYAYWADKAKEAELTQKETIPGDSKQFVMSALDNLINAIE